jgi:hypothetical protein
MLISYRPYEPQQALLLPAALHRCGPTQVGTKRCSQPSDLVLAFGQVPMHITARLDAGSRRAAGR